MKKIRTVKITRVVGYMRPITGWNKGKQKEWSQRKLISETTYGRLN